MTHYQLHNQNDDDIFTANNGETFLRTWLSVKIYNDTLMARDNREDPRRYFVTLELTNWMLDFNAADARTFCANLRRWEESEYTDEESIEAAFFSVTCAQCEAHSTLEEGLAGYKMDMEAIADTEVSYNEELLFRIKELLELALTRKLFYSMLIEQDLTEYRDQIAADEAYFNEDGSVRSEVVEQSEEREATSGSPLQGSVAKADVDPMLGDTCNPA